MDDAPRIPLEPTPPGDVAERGVGVVLTAVPAAPRRLAEAISSTLGLPERGIRLIAAARAIGDAAEDVDRAGLRSRCSELHRALELGTGRNAAFDLALRLNGDRDRGRSGTW